MTNQETSQKASPLNSNKIFDRLNEAQISAVSAPDGPIEVFAGAGSGKTMVIVARIVYLIQKGIDTCLSECKNYMVRAPVSPPRQRLKT